MNPPFDQSVVMFTSAAILAKTGRDWPEWFDLLDAAGAAGMTHAAIARLLNEQHQVDAWYAQGITVSWERVRGIRPIHGDRDGTFSVSASKTVAVPIETLFATWVDDTARGIWLEPHVLTLRTSGSMKSARFDQHDGMSILAVSFTDKGSGKSSVAIEEAKLPSQAIADERKAIWKSRLSEMAAYLKNGIAK